MKHSILSASLAIIALQSSSSAATILAGWETWGTGPSLPGATQTVNASTITTGVTASVFAPGQSGTQNAWAPSALMNNTTGTYGTTYSGASTDGAVSNSSFYANPTPTTAGTYLDFTITAGGSSTITLDSFHFDGSQGGNQSTRTWTLEVLTGSSITVGNVSGPTVFGNFNAFTQADISLTGLADFTLNAGESATFRMSFIGNGSGGNGQRVDNVGIAGTVVVVPEPSAALLGSIGILALLRRRRA